MAFVYRTRVRNELRPMETTDIELRWNGITVWEIRTVSSIGEIRVTTSTRVDVTRVCIPFKYLYVRVPLGGRYFAEVIIRRTVFSPGPARYNDGYLRLDCPAEQRRSRNNRRSASSSLSGKAGKRTVYNRTPYDDRKLPPYRPPVFVIMKKRPLFPFNSSTI